jgi:hypothetical protein
LPAVGGGGVIVDVTTDASPTRYGVALSARAVHGRRFHETTVIVVSPRHVIRNDTRHTVLVRQAGCEAAMTLLRGASRAWHWPNRMASPLLSVALLDDVDDNRVEYQWSGVSIRMYLCGTAVCDHKIVDVEYCKNSNILSSNCWSIGH